MAQILFRKLPNNEDELKFLQANWNKDKSIRWRTSRNKLHAGQTIVARYCSVPFTNEMIDDLAHYGCKMINNASQISFATKISEWYPYLEEFSPLTYMPGEWGMIRDDGQFFVRAETGSRKWLWNTHAFANSKSEAIEIANKLMDDSYLGSENVYIREYVPLMKVGELLNGLPESIEYRFFYMGHKMICSGRYWDNESYDNEPPEEAKKLAMQIASRINYEKKCNFYSIDLALTQSGKWVLIEINEGQMSGLCSIPASEFYENLWNSL
jgi:hypothetical protein